MVALLEARNLTKYYGNFKALNRVSFSLQRGEIVGFLGPNGAGKTTTMRILSGYFPPTEGEVLIEGQDLWEDPLYAKSLIGYLPENPPLYNELTVREYLSVVGHMKGLPYWRAKNKADDTIDILGLEEYADTLIGKLSKGYRKRVGIAQALVHDPEIVILDEPTEGLDVQQKQEVRALIKSLAKKRTVILSTHIMQEVEAVCEKVIVINRGEIIAQGSVDELLAQRIYVPETLRLILRIQNKSSVNQIPNIIQKIKGVISVEPRGTVENKAIFQIKIEPSMDPRAEVVEKLVKQGYGVIELSPVGVPLENVLMRLTVESTEAEETV